MKGSAGNYTSTASGYFWAECDTYEDGPSTGLVILFATYTFEFLVGAPSNTWLICHIHKKRSEVSGVLPADFFPLHLAMTQLIFYLILPVFTVNHYLWQSDNVLTMVTFLNAMIMIMKPLLHCLICVERYMAVVRPLDYLRFKGRQYRWGCLGAAWCIYIIMTSVALFDRSSTTACVLILPVLVIDTFCSLSVLRKLRRSPPGDRHMMEQRKKTKGEKKVKTHKNRSPVVNTEEGKQGQSRGKEKRTEAMMKKMGSSQPKVKGEMNSMKKKAFNTIVIIQAVLTLNCLPFIIILFMDGRVPARKLKCQYESLALAAAAGFGYLQPLLYLHKLGRLPCMRSQST